jgi:hypothetical protein
LQKINGVPTAVPDEPENIANIPNPLVLQKDEEGNVFVVEDDESQQLEQESELRVFGLK